MINNLINLKGGELESMMVSELEISIEEEINKRYSPPVDDFNLAIDKYAKELEDWQKRSTTSRFLDKISGDGPFISKGGIASLRKNLQTALKYKNEGFYSIDILREINIRPSQLDGVVSVHWPSWYLITHLNNGGDYRKSSEENQRYIGVRNRINFVHLKELVKTSDFEDKLVLTTGRITGHALVPDLELRRRLAEAENKNSDPPIIFEDEAGNKVSCSYNSYDRLEGHRTYLTRLLNYEDGKKKITPSIAEELSAFIESAKSKKERVIVGGKINEGILVADLFIFNKNYSFAYFVKPIRDN